MRGCLDVGYDISYKTKYCLRLSSGAVIGAYNCTFNKKALFKYKVSKTLKAYTIRKLDWYNHINDDQFKDIAVSLKKTIEINYTIKIKDKITFIQTAHMKRVSGRADMNEILTVVDIKTDKPILTINKEGIKI